MGGLEACFVRAKAIVTIRDVSFGQAPAPIYCGEIVAAGAVLPQLIWYPPIFLATSLRSQDRLQATKTGISRRAAEIFPLRTPEQAVNGVSYPIATVKSALERASSES